ncbi:hypothetical protein GOBAR_DD21193 [Gossypium barbadense]|nr:hypothetical protein GOBAR_DD21193 [Gossypium barbadense]
MNGKQMLPVSGPPGMWRGSLALESCCGSMWPVIRVIPRSHNHKIRIRKNWRNDGDIWLAYGVHVQDSRAQPHRGHR